MSENLVRITSILNTRNLDHEINRAIKWMTKGLTSYRKLVDTSRKFSFEYLVKIFPFGILDDATKQVQVRQIFSLVFGQLITSLEAYILTSFCLLLLRISV